MSHLFATIAAWEYGCCGDLPEPGTRLTGTLHARPAGTGIPFPVTEPFTWHADLQLLHFAGWSARWDPENGDPAAQPIVVWLSWHDDLPLLPTVAGTVTATYLLTASPDAGDVDPVGETIQLTQVTALERFPDLRRVVGVTVAFAVEECSEPTEAARIEYAALLERASRTVDVTGPAIAFGDLVPACESRFAIDLDDPRLVVENRPAGISGLVTGQTGQVSLAVPGPLWVSFASVPAGTPTAELDHDLLVTLLIDPEHCRSSGTGSGSAPVTPP